MLWAWQCFPSFVTLRFLDSVASIARASSWSPGGLPAGALWFDDNEHPVWRLKLRTSSCDIKVISFSAQPDKDRDQSFSLDEQVLGMLIQDYLS